MTNLIQRFAAWRAECCRREWVGWALVLLLAPNEPDRVIARRRMTKLERALSRWRRWNP